MSDSGDDEYLALKPSLRRAIDTAFLKLSQRAQAQSETDGSRKKRRAYPEDEEGSGEAGGFVKESKGANEAASDEGEQSVPLSLVPTGLQMLDLPPDDEEVLAVFRNAATGWESRPSELARRRKAGVDSDGEDRVLDKDAGLMVSKDDWRAVCAVLIGQQAEPTTEVERKPKAKSKTKSRKAPLASGSKRKSPDEPEDQPERRVTRGQTRASLNKQEQLEDSDEEGGGFLVGDEEGGGFIPDSGDEGGGFVPASDEEDEPDGSDSDTYFDQLAPDSSSESEFGAPSRQKPSRSKPNEPDSDRELDEDDNWEDDTPRTLTVRQLREAKLAFALFFPGEDVNDPAFGSKRMGVKEVAEAAKRLNENLSTNDITEMLSLFSSGPSDTIGIEEFGRMAVMARLI